MFDLLIQEKTKEKKMDPIINQIYHETGYIEGIHLLGKL